MRVRQEYERLLSRGLSADPCQARSVSSMFRMCYNELIGHHARTYLGEGKNTSLTSARITWCRDQEWYRVSGPIPGVLQ